MTIHRLALVTAALLLGTAPMAHAGGRHVDVSVSFGFPGFFGYVEQAAPVVVYPPAPAIYYRPAYVYPGRYYYRDRDDYRDNDRYEGRHSRWHYREDHRRYHRDRDDD